MRKWIVLPAGQAESRDIGVEASVYGLGLSIILSLLASTTTAMVYGLGGILTVRGDLQIGTLVALAALLSQLFGPITSLANMQVSVMTALVSFDRVFELLDLKPLVDDQPGAVALPVVAESLDSGTAPDIEFEPCLVSVPDPQRSVARIP